MKKLVLLVVIASLSFSASGCDIDPAMMEMIMSFVGGFAGFDGTAFNGEGGNTGNQGWAMAGSQLRDMWMSQSENSQDGRDMSSLLQANQTALDYSLDRGQPSATEQNNSGTGTGDTNTSQTSEKKDSLWDKAMDKVSNLDADDWSKIMEYGSKLNK